MIQNIISVLLLVVMYLALRELKIIASDAKKKEELTQAMDKFAEIYLKEKEKKGKVVSFIAKDE